MDKRNERVLALSAVLALVWLLVDAVLAPRTHLLVLSALLPYLALAVVLCLFVLVRLRLARLAEEEKRDLALAKQEKTDPAAAGLFEHEPGKFEPFTVGRSHDQFERWIVAAAAVLLAVAEGWWAWRLYRGLAAPAPPPSERLLAAAFLAGQAFTFFLLSRFLLGLSRVTGVGQASSLSAQDRAGKGQAGSLSYGGRPEKGPAAGLSDSGKLLRGPGVMLGIACFAVLVALAAAVVGQAGQAVADWVAALVLIGFLGLLAVENGVNFVGELYRPRRGHELNRAYESRLGGLLTDPATWVKNVAGALDYQFGYKVSETWLYRFLERALLPFVLFQVLVLYLLSSLVFLGPAEEAIVERFGRPRAGGGCLTSGFHLKWPWPFERVRRFPVKRILRLEIGYQPGAGAPGTGTNVVVWTVPHYAREDQFLTASRSGETATNQTDLSVPVNLMSFNVPIEYQIDDVYKYAYGCAEPAKALAAIAYRSLTLEAASSGLFEMMTDGRLAVARAVGARMQAAADRLGLGVRIVFVGLQGVHPPVSVADAFESVVGASEEREATILKAHAEANRILPLAAADAVKVGDEAAAYAVRRREISAAEADQFLKRLGSYQKAPQVFQTRLYLSSLSAALANSRKYIVAAAPSSEVLQFDFTEKLRSDLFDFGPGTTPPPAGEKK